MLMHQTLGCSIDDGGLESTQPDTGVGVLSELQGQRRPYKLGLAIFVSQNCQGNL